ncbi:MAG TPA: adenylate/guanylate cyclase domain-containing protein [Solirubrobacteraceae bacterium]|nr:adenylate/guanylate cyclase domain-containing protein [Solirubrobacteraceae bacterium]
MAPTTRYARNGDVNLAYQIHGDGPIDLIVVNTFISHVEHLWDNPGFARFLTRLAQLSRLIIWDRRGSGLSDHGPLGLEHEVGDVVAVLDAAGSERAAVLAYNAGGPLAALHAARHPDRVGALVLYASLLHAIRDDDMPWIESAEERERRVGGIIERWGQGTNLEVLAPTAADDPQLRTWLARLERLAASPGQARRLVAAAAQVDVRPVLASIEAPTLVLHRSDEVFVDVRHGREYARRIPGARLVELPGVDSLPSVGDSDALLGEIEEFLTGRRRGGEQERALLTVLFTDIVGSTARAAELGDKRWRDLLAMHDTEVRRTARRFGGEVVQRIGDGFLAVFDGAPSRAVRCAAALRQAVSAEGIELRIGLHTGECEIIGDDVGGMAVHIASRVGDLAKAGEIIVSGTTYGTVVGAGLDFDYRGEHMLKGVPGRWPIFALNG